MYTCSIIMGIPTEVLIYSILAIALLSVVALVLGRGLTFEMDKRGRIALRIKPKKKRSAPPKSTEVNVLNNAKVTGNVDIDKVVGTEQTTFTSQDKSQ